MTKQIPADGVEWFNSRQIKNHPAIAAYEYDGSKAALIKKAFDLIQANYRSTHIGKNVKVTSKLSDHSPAGALTYPIEITEIRGSLLRSTDAEFPSLHIHRDAIPQLLTTFDFLSGNAEVGKVWDRFANQGKKAISYVALLDRQQKDISPTGAHITQRTGRSLQQD